MLTLLRYDIKVIEFKMTYFIYTVRYYL